LRSIASVCGPWVTVTLVPSPSASNTTRVIVGSMMPMSGTAGEVSTSSSGFDISATSKCTGYSALERGSNIVKRSRPPTRGSISTDSRGTSKPSGAHHRAT
jgi:hypothetical protein